MPNPIKDIAGTVTDSVSAKLRDSLGNAAILAIVALLALTAWVVCIAALVAVLTPLWGLAAALLTVALLVIVMAVILLIVLKSRTRAQRLRAEIRKAETRHKTRATVAAALPGLLRHRPGALVVGLGLAIGAMLVATLQRDKDP